MTDDFIVLGCDGLYDHLTNEEIITFVDKKMSAMQIGEQDTGRVAEELVQFAKKTNLDKTDGARCDNISAIVVPLTRGILPQE